MVLLCVILHILPLSCSVFRTVNRKLTLAVAMLDAKRPSRLGWLNRVPPASARNVPVHWSSTTRRRDMTSIDDMDRSSKQNKAMPIDILQRSQTARAIFEDSRSRFLQGNEKESWKSVFVARQLNDALEAMDLSAVNYLLRIHSSGQVIQHDPLLQRRL